MPTSFTIVSSTVNYLAILEAVERSVTAKIKVKGPREKWTAIQLQLAESTITITNLVFVEPGDKFSTLVFDMHNVFSEIKTKAKSNRAFLEDRIADAEMIIGYVCNPSFNEDESHDQCLWAIVEAVDGMVFTGHAMLNVEGKRILDMDGKADIVVSK